MLNAEDRTRCAKERFDPSLALESLILVDESLLTLHFCKVSTLCCLVRLAVRFGDCLSTAGRNASGVSVGPLL